MFKKIKRIMIHIKELVLKFRAGNKFCEMNKKCWDSSEAKGEYIYIAYTLHDMLEMLYEALLFAKGMSCVSNYNFTVLTSKGEMLLKKLCKSFYVDCFILNKFSMKLYMKALAETFKMQKIICSGKDLLRYRYKNILIGSSTYDTVLLRTGRCTYEGEKSIKVFGIFFRSILLVEQLTNIFSQNPPTVCIVMEEAYEAEIYRRVVKSYGGNIVWVSQMLKKYIDQNGKVTTFYDQAIIREIGEKLSEVQREGNYIAEVDKQLLNYYQNGDTAGIKGRVLSGAAVKDKVTKTREQIVAELNLDSSKKNVLIFSHCMTDGPHACYRLLYQDYFVWLKRTLEIACNVKTVNWIVKFHPDRFKRKGHEMIDTQRIVDKFNSVDNIYFFPDSYSLLSAQTLADVVITARGKVGEEMSCYGIPVITAGQPCYSVWGYTYSFNETEEYEKCLLNVEKIEKLETDKIDMAKSVFYAHSISSYEIVDDNMGQEINKSIQERKKGIISGRVANANFFKKMASVDMLNKMKESHIYKAGNDYVKEMKDGKGA